MIIKRECDVPMARSKRLFPCDKDCRNCMACIETTDTGERRHCTRHKNTNIRIDMMMVSADLTGKNGMPKAPETRRPWTDIESKRLVFLREKGLNWREIGMKMKRTEGSVKARYNKITSGKNPT